MPGRCSSRRNLPVPLVAAVFAFLQPASAPAEPQAIASPSRTAILDLANPLLNRHPILFVVRKQYARDHHNTGTMFHPGEINAGSFQGGGAIRTIDFARDGRITTLWESSQAVARDPDVRFDGKKILFAMRPDGSQPYHIFEMNADGSGFVQLTFGPHASDIDPAYLPDGRIVFASTRDPKYCGCNRHIQANLFVMDADGANVHQIGRNNLFESRPSVMDDGRILYDRWEYVDRHFGPSFGLWTVRPDGTRHDLFYGNNAWSPGAIFDARTVPGSQQFVAVFGACHDRPWGAMVLVDRRRGMDGTEPLVRSWPADIRSVMPDIQEVPDKPTMGHPHAGLIDRLVQLPVKYEDPWPLSDEAFLCSRMTGHGEQMGIYLLDVFGNELLLRMENPGGSSRRSVMAAMGCFDPMPLGPRRRPDAIPSDVELAQSTATFYVTDVYRGSGMESVPRGTVKTIRVVEAPPKRHWTRAGYEWAIDTHQAPAMNFNCTNNKRILGDAPVEPDGSAYFEVPSDRFVFFQLLDERGMMVQSMRSGTTTRPGERTGCVGCHENRRSSVPADAAPLAMRRGASKLKPWYGPPREFSYRAEVQPVFDKHCVECHDYGKEAGAALNLAGDLGMAFNTSYLALRTKSPIRWNADKPGEPKSLIKAVDDGPPHVLPPYAWGSHRSRLVDVLIGDHYDMQLDRESFDRVVTWIDLNAPYYPNYASVFPDNLFGRSPLNDRQLTQLADLTGVPVNARKNAAELSGSQISFTRPERSPCLAKLDKDGDKYGEALAIIRAGQDTLAKTPRADMAKFQLVSDQDRSRQERCDTLAQAEIASRKAILQGCKFIDKPPEPPPTRLISPVAVASSSGQAFPLGAKNGAEPDPRYVAAQAIDGNLSTFCCLLDDSGGGDSATTIPAKATEPVTGHIVFDLGRPLPVRGARLIARHTGGPYNPRLVDFVALAEPNLPIDQTDPLVGHHSYGRLQSGAAEDLYWDEHVTRYVALRVKSGYESGGPVHYNFQIAEMQFHVNAEADVPPEILVGWDEQQKLAKEAASLRAAIEDLHQSFPDRYPAESLLDQLAELERCLGEDSPRPSPEALGRASRVIPIGNVREGLEALRREALVDANPLMPERLLFVKRFTYSPGFYYAEFMRASRFGGNLCVLDVSSGQLTELAPELAGGIFDRCDLSFDARRVVFAYKAAPGQGFRLWEVGIDGSGLRQLTFDPDDEQDRIAKYWHPRNKPSGVYRHHTDDFHPCYLPDGGICFASTRCEQGVLCDQGDSLAVNVLYRLDPTPPRSLALQSRVQESPKDSALESQATRDASEDRKPPIRRLSQGALSESTPSVANDGRILYTRWEYVDKGVIAVQSLWAMRPDGSGSTEIYGNQIAFPPVLIHGRAVPGSNQQFVATATMHHPFAVGPIMLIDTQKDIRTHKPLQSLTPDTSLSIDGVGSFPNGEKFTHLKNGQWVADNIGPLYSEPYPLADPATGAGAGKYFLVDCNPDKAWNDPTAYGLYLIDAFGNRVKIYDDPTISCWQPMPLVARERPPVIPATEPQPEANGQQAVLAMSDIYRGLEGVPRGTVKYLRILEQVSRPWSARRFWPDDETHGQHAVISMNAHIFVKIHHGVVPVEEDGSAHFVVPAEKNLFFQALDEDYMEIYRMRSFVNLQPGETRSCIGCHEPKASAPPLVCPQALSRSPNRLTAQPGETVPRPIHYVTDVQPILDRHCVSCHNPQKPDGDIDLCRELTTFFNRSYETIMSKDLVAHIQEFKGPQVRAQKQNVVPLSPYALGSTASRLITLTRDGHYDCQLTPEEQIRLTTWADANAPYYGSYFGRRNLKYRDHPDFRPVPTAEDYGVR